MVFLQKYFVKIVLPLPHSSGCGIYSQLWTGTVSVELGDIILIRNCKEIKISTEIQFHPICIKNKYTTGNTPQEIRFSWPLHHTSEIQPVLNFGLCKHSSLINQMEKPKCLCGLEKKSLINDTQKSTLFERSSNGTSCSGKEI